MKLKVKDFFKVHFSAILIGLLIVGMFIVTYGMVISIKNGIEGFDLIYSPAAVALDDSIPAGIGDMYIVKEYDSRIGVFVPGDTQPIRVIEVYVMYLPEADRAKLREGIEVNGKKALEQLLDDFWS